MRKVPFVFHNNIAEYFLFPLVELSKIKARLVALLRQLVHPLVQINLLTFLRTVATFGKFVITSLFVYSVRLCTVNHDTYSNLMYIIYIIHMEE